MLIISKLHKLIDHGVTAAEIARVAGKSPATISRLLNGNSLFDLMSAVKLTKEYFPEEEQELMTDFCLGMDRKNGRTALEYSMINRNDQLTDQLIEKYKHSNNRLDREWANAYKYEMVRNEFQTPPMERLNEIQQTKVNSVEMKVYHMILIAYCYVDLGQFDLLRSTLLEAEGLIEQINDEYVRGSYQVRLGQALSVISVNINNIEECRKYGKLVVENELFQSLSAPAYHALGHSYLLQNCDRALTYLKEARKIFISRKRKVSIDAVEQSINFVQIYHGLEPSYLKEGNEIRDQHAVAFHLLNQGYIQEAKAILHACHLDQLDDDEKAFHYFYLGKADGNADYFFDSVYYFKKVGRLFYAQLPCLELQKLGVSMNNIRALSI